MPLACLGGRSPAPRPAAAEARSVVKSKVETFAVCSCLLVVTIGEYTVLLTKVKTARTVENKNVLW